MPEPKIDEIDRTDDCLSDMKRQSKRFRAVADALEGNPPCRCANGVCECGLRVIHPPEEEVAEATFPEWLNRISFALE